MIEAFELACELFPFFILLNILTIRFTSPQGFIPKSLWTGVFYSLAVVPFFFRAGLIAGLYSLGLSFVLWCLCVFILVCSQNSVTLRMMDEIDSASNHSLSAEELLKKFSDEESIKARLATMAENNYLIFENSNTINLTARSIRLSKTNLILRKLFSIKA